MAYSIIPDATDKPSVSQQEIKDNFSEIQTVIGANHVTFTGASGDQGKHEVVELTNQSAPTVTSTDLAIYNFLQPVSSTQELYVKRATGAAVAITGGLNSGQGWTRVGSGAYFIWGRQVSDANTSADTTIDVSHCPAAGTILQVICHAAPASISGTSADYVVVPRTAASLDVTVMQRTESTLTRLASKQFTFLVIRL